jgi:hypothetical protein
MPKKKQNIVNYNQVSDQPANPVYIPQRQYFEYGDPRGQVRPQQPSYIQQVNPQSIPSKAWDVVTHPATAASYALNKQRLPDNFVANKNSLDYATEIVNPTAWFYNAPAIPEEVYRGEYGPAALHTVEALAAASGMEPFNTVTPLPNVIKGGYNTFKNTSDLPFVKRVDNAINAASLEIPYVGDITSHSYFHMTPQEVKYKMMREVERLPQGASTFDRNMSANSSPLYWNQAARNANKDFTIIRTGENQQLNTGGTQGRRVAEAIPMEMYYRYPDIMQDFNNRVDQLKKMGNVDQAKKLYKQGVSNDILNELTEEIVTKGQTRKETIGLYNKFLENYKPELDKPINLVNGVTGLNFPKTKIVTNESEFPFFTQPTIAAVKGNPKQRFKNLLPKTDEIKKNLKDLYLGESSVNIPNESQFNYKNGGEVIRRADGHYSQRGLWDNIRENRGSGKKPTKEMLKQEAKIKAQHEDGGSVPNEMDEYGNGGYIVKRSNERKGKTHVVIGPDGTKKYFGDSKLGQHPNDPERKKAFYARHKHNLAHNPYFRAFARKTWEDGGEVYENGTMMMPYQSTPTYDAGGYMQPWRMDDPNQPNWINQGANQNMMQQIQPWNNYNANTAMTNSTAEPLSAKSQGPSGSSIASGIGGIASSIGGALSGITSGGTQFLNALIPNQSQRTTRRYNPANYNPYSMGTGSQAIYEDGGNLINNTDMYNKYADGGYTTRTRKKGNIVVTEDVPVEDVTAPSSNAYMSPVGNYMGMGQMQQPQPYAVPVPMPEPTMSYMGNYDVTGNLTGYTPVGSAGYQHYPFIRDVQSSPSTYQGLPVTQSPQLLRESYQNFVPGSQGSQWQPYSDPTQMPYTVKQHRTPEDYTFEDGGPISMAMFGQNFDDNPRYIPDPQKTFGNYEPNNQMVEAKSGIHLDPAKKGTFTAAATKHGMGVQQFAKHVLSNKDKFSSLMVQKANFAKNAAKWKHEFGGLIDTNEAEMTKYGGNVPNNPGFNALPKSVQQKIMSNMEYGGDMGMGINPQMDSEVMNYGGEARSGIHINPANKGKFNALKKRTGKSTEELTHSKNPLTRKRAIFAQNAAKWKHDDGGMVQGQTYDLTPDQISDLISKGYQIDFE